MASSSINHRGEREIIRERSPLRKEGGQQAICHDSFEAGKLKQRTGINPLFGKENQGGSPAEIAASS